MTEKIWQIVLLVITSLCGWLFGKLQTKREQKKTDLQIIEQAIAPQLESIKKLTEQNNALVEMYLSEQGRRVEVEMHNKELIAHNEELNRKITLLNEKVDRMDKKINNLLKNGKDAAHHN